MKEGKVKWKERGKVKWKKEREGKEKENNSLMRSIYYYLCNVKRE